MINLQIGTDELILNAMAVMEGQGKRLTIVSIADHIGCAPSTVGYWLPRLRRAGKITWQFGTNGSLHRIRQTEARG